MADRYFQQFRGSLDREVVKLYGKVTIGAAGAVSADDSLGFSVAKTASETGRYTVTLEDRYPEFLGCHVTVEEAADAAVTVLGGVAVRNVSVNDSTPTFDLQCLSAAGADTNPASGTVLYVEVTLKNASE